MITNAWKITRTVTRLTSLYTQYVDSIRDTFACINRRTRMGISSFGIIIGMSWNNSIRTRIEFLVIQCFRGCLCRYEMRTYPLHEVQGFGNEFNKTIENCSLSFTRNDESMSKLIGHVGALSISCCQQLSDRVYLIGGSLPGTCQWARNTSTKKR